MDLQPGKHSGLGTSPGYTFIPTKLEGDFPSGADATSMLIRMLVAAGVSGTSTNQDGQHAVLFYAPAIHLNVMLHVVSSNDH